MAELKKLSRRQSLGPVVPVPTERRDQYLAFTLQDETFAMEIRSVREVIQFEGLTDVPLMPHFVRGVINLRGAVVPVIDLSVRFGRSPTMAAKRTCIAILELTQNEGTILVGLMVDHVNEVMEIAQSEIEPAPTFGNTLRSEFIAGVGKVNGKFIILLDVAHVLSLDEMAVLTTNQNFETETIPEA